MPLKVVPFAEVSEGNWSGKFGRYGVEIRRSVGNAYRRGPESEVVLETDGESYGYSVRGSHSGTAYTLAGAMEASERDCIRLQGGQPPHGGPRYGMSEEEARLEAAARKASMAEAVEADRIAHANGWPMAMDVLPDLRRFAEDEGLHPFPDPTPGP